MSIKNEILSGRTIEYMSYWSITVITQSLLPQRWHQITRFLLLLPQTLHCIQFLIHNQSRLVSDHWLISIGRSRVNPSQLFQMSFSFVIRQNTQQRKLFLFPFTYLLNFIFKLFVSMRRFKLSSQKSIKSFSISL